MGKIWSAAKTFALRFWGWILVAVAAVFGGLGLLSEIVSRVNFIDDLKDALRTLKPVTDFFVRQPEWAFYPLWIATLLVGVAVALARWRPLVSAMLNDRAEGENKAPTRNRAMSQAISAWKPDMTMQELAQYLQTRSRFAQKYGTDVTGITREVHEALYGGRITAWARVHPDEAEFQVDTAEWNWADLNRTDGNAHLRRLKMPLYSLRFARGEVEAAWPR